MSTEIVPAKKQMVVKSDDIVRENVAVVLAKHPELISFDPAEPAHERTILRCKVDSGMTHEQKADLTLLVSDWWFGAVDMPRFICGRCRHVGTKRDESCPVCRIPLDEEIEQVPCLALLSADGALARFYGIGPGLRSWLSLLRAAGVDRCKQGLMVRCKLQPSQTAGRHYWVIVPA